MVSQVDLKEVLPQWQQLMREGVQVPMVITGSSMNPFLVHLRDTVFLSQPGKVFHKGDLVFYTRENGQHVLHRVHHIDKAGMLYTVGDAHTEIEGPLDPACVFAQIRKVIRKGKKLQAGDFLWWFFSQVWIRILPLRPLCRRFFSYIPRKKA